MALSEETLQLSPLSDQKTSLLGEMDKLFLRRRRFIVQDFHPDFYVFDSHTQERRHVKADFKKVGPGPELYIASPLNSRELINLSTDVVTANLKGGSLHLISVEDGEVTGFKNNCYGYQNAQLVVLGDYVYLGGAHLLRTKKDLSGEMEESRVNLVGNLAFPEKIVLLGKTKNCVVTLAEVWGSEAGKVIEYRVHLWSEEMEVLKMFSLPILPTGKYRKLLGRGDCVFLMSCHRITKLDTSSGVTSAVLEEKEPFHITSLDISSSGWVLATVTDSEKCYLRRISPTGEVTTLTLHRAFPYSSDTTNYCCAIDESHALVVSHSGMYQICCLEAGEVLVKGSIGVPGEGTEEGEVGKEKSLRITRVFPIDLPQRESREEILRLCRFLESCTPLPTDVLGVVSNFI